MRILVVGAAGKTGRAVVDQARAAGHEVTAFVRHAEGYDRPGVDVREGDAADPGAMDAAVAGQDAVIDTIGGKTPYKETTLETSAARTIIAAMQRNGVRRLVATSMIGYGDSAANASGLDWVIVRPAILSDDPETGDVRVYTADTGEKAHTITRSDLASFLVAQLAADEHLNQAVAIANHRAGRS